MNSIQLDSISKKFGTQVIFKEVNFSICEGEHAAITGYNGSGKSTLLQVIAGYITPSSGNVKHLVEGKPISFDKIYQYISFAAPYLDLIEEFSTFETIEFYAKFKSFHNSILPDEVLEIAQLTHARNKAVKFFSSGMKQRIKLTLALLTDVPFVFLDEPVSNLDKPGVAWFSDMISRYAFNKIILVSSNELKEEMDFCTKILRIEDYKN